MPAGGLRPQLVSPLTAGAEDGVAVAELATTAALGNGAAAGLDVALSEPPPPQAVRSASRLRQQSRATGGLGCSTRTTGRLKAESMNKLSVCAGWSHAVGCNQTKADV